MVESIGMVKGNVIESDYLFSEREGAVLFHEMSRLGVFTRYQLLGVEIAGNRNKPIYRIYTDIEGGVNLDGCAEVSKDIAPWLETYLQGEGDARPYSVEVSSPGVDRPFFSKGDYLAHLYRFIVVKTKRLVEGRKNFKGKLIGCSLDNDTITIEIEEKQQVRISFESIRKGYLDFFHP